MLFKQNVLEGIAEGRVTLAFRRWKKPAVLKGSTLRTAIGVLTINAVDVVHESNLTKTDARRAGFDSLDELQTVLNRGGKGRIYRIALRRSGADPRVALRKRSKMSADERAQVLRRLASLDTAAAQRGRRPWTQRVLKLIHNHAGVRTELAAKVDRPTHLFKTDVRKLKELGLTESLQPGYRLSPRGIAITGLPARPKRPGQSV